MTRLPFAILTAALLAALPLQAQEQVAEGRGAVMRGLDKISGDLTDMEIASGHSQEYGRILVTVEDCRFPTDNPAGNAYAHVTITDPRIEGDPLFKGWMVASSPGLNALDNPRYDVWVLRCMTS